MTSPKSIRDRVSALILEHFHPPGYSGGSWRLRPHDAADAVLGEFAVFELPEGAVRPVFHMARLVWPVTDTPGADEVELRYGEVWWGNRRWRLRDGEDPTVFALALLAATAEARRQVCDE